MPWVRLDDGFTEHPKIAELGPDGIALHVSALCYCNRQLTDGYVPESVAERLLGVGMHVAVGDLVRVGVWHDKTTIADCPRCEAKWKPAYSGYLIHDFTDYQPTRSQVESERESARERMRKRREQAVRPNFADIQEKFTDPVPVPEPPTAKGSRPNAIDDDRWRELERILACVTDADSSTPSVLANYARQLPIGMVAKVRESAETHSRRVGAGWVVNALKDEIKARAA